MWSWSNSYLSPQTMQICSSSHNHKYHQPIYVHWSLSWSIQKLFCTSTSQKIQPWQRKLIQLQANISPILPIQTHRTTCSKPTCWPSQWKQPHELFPVCLHQIQLYWNHFTCCTRPHYQLEPWVNSKSLVCVFLIFLPPLTLLTIPFFYTDSNLGLVSLTLSYLGFSLTFHLVPLLLISMASNLLPLNFSTVFLKVLFLVLYSSYSIQLHSVQ